MGSISFHKFFKILSRRPGRAYLRQRIRAFNGEWLSLQRVVSLSGGGMRGYYYGPRSGIRAVDRHRVTRIVKRTRDKVWLA